MNQDVKNQKIIISFIGIIPVIWCALLIAPYIDKGLLGIIKNFNSAVSNPFDITICNNSFKTILFFLLIYLFSIILYFSTRKNYRWREEHGSAKWGGC